MIHRSNTWAKLKLYLTRKRHERDKDFISDQFRPLTKSDDFFLISFFQALFDPKMYHPETESIPGNENVN